MLRKLMKHEFRATGRVMGPLFGLLLIAAIAARFSVGVLLESSARFLNLLGGLFTTAFVIAIVGVCVMSLVLMINRFRTNLLGDEGYIMFTLPASVHQQIWSKLIVSAVWFIATGLAVVAAGFILVAQQGFWLAFSIRSRRASRSCSRRFAATFLPITPSTAPPSSLNCWP